MDTKIKKINCSKGLALVEAAIVLPIIILLTMGLIEYGWMFLKAHQITNAARQAARVAIRPDATSGDVTAVITKLMQDSNITGYELEISAVDVGSGNLVTVTISVPFENIAILNIPLLPKPDNIHSTITMSKEGP